MQVYTGKLKELMKKASFNHAFDSVRLTFDHEKVVSNMRQPDGDFQVLINMENNVLKNGHEKLEINFAVDKKPPTFSFETDEPKKCEIVENKFVVYTKMNSKGQIAKDDLTLYPPKFVDDYVSDNGLPESESEFFSTDVTINFFEEIQKLKKSSKNIFYTVKGRRLSLNVDDTIYKFSQQIAKEYNNINVCFDYKNFKRLMDILRDENKKYKINFLYDQQNWVGSFDVVSDDNSEHYVLNGRRHQEISTAIQPLDFEERYEHPQVPENWNYVESVEKICKVGYRWKNLTKEIAEELWIAKQILPKSQSEAAKIRHGSIQPGMTWTKYCNDIGSSPQVVNRWLKRWFDESHSNDGDTSGHTGDSSECLYMESIKRVIGSEIIEPKSIDEDWKRPVFLSLSGRDASKFAGKLLQEFENKNVAEAVVDVKTQNMTKTWFKPLFDHLLCFANENNGCLIYLGSNRDKFIKEFDQHGIILAKVG